MKGLFLLSDQDSPRQARDKLFILFVVRPGFEPGKAEPKSAVLPLHHRTISKSFPIRDCKSKKKLKTCNR